MTETTPLADSVQFNAHMLFDASFVEHRFLQSVKEIEPKVVQTLTWETERTTIGKVAGFERVFTQTTSDVTAVVLVRDGVRCLVKLSTGNLWALIASEHPPGSIAKALREAFPAPDPIDRTTRMLFWSQGPFGGAFESRPIEVHAWNDVRSNYSSETVTELDRFMAFRPASSGKLVLLHGPPGTGKTNALRALAWEWRSWCSFEYVLDPENLFQEARYLHQVAIRDSGRNHWRAVLLEDTGELLRADAKQYVGQSLSRLLNLSDGLPGQSMKTLFIITTNEELGELHPAVARPGRCAAKIGFRPFSPKEATEWLVERGHSLRGTTPRTLAEMYAVLFGTDVATGTRRVGFAPS